MPTQNDNTALHWASQEGHLDTVEELVTAGAEQCGNKVSVSKLPHLCIIYQLRMVMREWRCTLQLLVSIIFIP